MKFLCGIHDILIYSNESCMKYESQNFAFLLRGTNYVCRRCVE